MKITSAAVVVMTCLTPLAACSPPDPPKPTLTSATEHLKKDATELVTFAESRSSGRLEVTEKVDKDRQSGCTSGEIQRFFRAQGKFARSGQQSPSAAAGLLGSQLGSKRYDTVVDDLDLWSNNISVEVRRNSSLGVTFVIASQVGEPNILIVGKTDCFKPEGKTTT